MAHLRALWICFALLVAACGGDGSASGTGSTGNGGSNGGSGGGSDGGAGGGGPSAGVVQVVIFTHIEDTTPVGDLGTAANRDNYLAVRATLIEVAKRAQTHGLQWVLQPDWKILEAALLYEDATVTDDTSGKNFLRYLRDDLGAVIDPHSHEKFGYNYTDVAYLLDQLEVGGSTVIGGHIWDPALPQFQKWDRFREPVPGLKYPTALWRGDILIGAGTPNHVNDPLVSGAWRPLDRDHFFTDDPAGNIVAFGKWHDDVGGVEELVNLYATGEVPPDAMLTVSWNVTLDVIMPPSALETYEESVFVPIAALRDQGLVAVTDFTKLAATWQDAYGGKAFLHQP